MTVKEKLQFIQQLAGLTQSELASRLSVTFAALNRWINFKSIPRKKMLQKIDKLYLEYSGEKKIPQSVPDAKRELIFRKQKLHNNALKEILDNPDILDQFLLSLTYHSNGIEGSSLTQNETAAILFRNAALPNKNLVEQLEAKNHETALRYLFNYLTTKKPINEMLILKLQGILLSAIRADAGNYRNHPVRITGAYVPTANHLKIPNLIKELIRDLHHSKQNVVAKSALFHSCFEQIHPFADGNGRIGRLLMHAMLLNANLPPAVILQKNRRFYNLYLNKAQMKEDFGGLEDFIVAAILEGYKILERML